MKLTIEELESGIRCLAVEGRLDMAGAAAIDLKFTSYAASSKSLILVDLSRLEFLASIGIRTLLVAAKAQRQRGGHFVICGAQPLVAAMIETAGLQGVIPLVRDRAAGVALLRAAPV